MHLPKYCDILAEGIRRKLEDMGFVPGSQVECVYCSPFGDPVAYYVMGQSPQTDFLFPASKIFSFTNPSNSFQSISVPASKPHNSNVFQSYPATLSPFVQIPKLIDTRKAVRDNCKNAIDEIRMNGGDGYP